MATVFLPSCPKLLILVDAGKGQNMASNNSLLTRLMSLPGQVDSEDRREILREITDRMAAAPDRYTRKEMENFDHLLFIVSPLIDRRMRRALAMALTKSNAPKDLVLDLLKYSDSRHIHILRRSAALTAADLMAIIREQIGRQAENLPLTDDLYPENRLSLPTSFLEAIYLLIFMEHRTSLKEKVPTKILAVLDRTVARFREQVLHDAMEEGRDKLLAARKEVMAKMRVNAIDEDYLSELLETSHRSEFLFALANKLECNGATLQRILNDQSRESIAIACASVGFSRNFFARMLHSMQKRNTDERFVLDLIAQYGKLEKDTAERVMRFLRIRISSVPAEELADQSEAQDQQSPQGFAQSSTGLQPESQFGLRRA